MTWSEVDLDARLWVLPRERSKNGKPHDIPLSKPAVAILESLPRIGDTFVLTTDGKSASSNYGANKKRLDALLPGDMPPWWLHDLRRTTASGMARLGVNLPVIEKVLNHSSGSFGGIVGVYQRFDFADEKRHALERWGAHVADLVSGRRSRNVVDLARRGLIAMRVDAIARGGGARGLARGAAPLCARGHPARASGFSTGRAASQCSNKTIDSCLVGGAAGLRSCAGRLASKWFCSGSRWANSPCWLRHHVVGIEVDAAAVEAPWPAKASAKREAQARTKQYAAVGPTTRSS